MSKSMKTLTIWGLALSILAMFVGSAMAQAVGQPVQGQLGLQGSASPVMEEIHSFYNMVNLIIIAIILVFGVGGMSFNFGEFALEGIGLAGVVGVVLNLVLPASAGE